MLPHGKFAPKEVIPRGWQKVIVPSTEADCGALVEDCVLRRSEMLARLRRVEGSRRKKKMIRAYCHSDSARIATLTLVARERHEFGGTHDLWTAKRLLEAGRELSLEEVRAHPIWVQPSEHGEPNSRPVFSFATWDVARQTLAHDALKATHHLPAWMFLYNGGEAAAKRWVISRLPQAKLVLVTDFPTCFPLLPWQLVETALPLSRRATEALLFEPWKIAKARGFGLKTTRPKWGPLFLGNIPMSDQTDEGLSGPSNCSREIGAGRGYPPGSVLSPFVVQVVLQRILEEARALHADGVELGLFADNLIIVLTDKDLEGPVRDGLKAMALKHFDAELTNQFCGRIRSFSPKGAIPFLGREFRKKAKEIRAYALAAHCDRIEMRVLGDLGRIKTSADLRRSTNRVVGFLVHHGAAPNAAQSALRAMFWIGQASKEIAGGDDAPY